MGIINHTPKVLKYNVKHTKVLGWRQRKRFSLHTEKQNLLELILGNLCGSPSFLSLSASVSLLLPASLNLLFKLGNWHPHPTSPLRNPKNTLRDLLSLQIWEPLEEKLFKKLSI
jgi:hypothetical protein